MLRGLSQSQGQIVCYCTHRRSSGSNTHRDSNKTVGASLGEEADLVFNGDRFQFGEKKQSWRWMAMMMPLNCIREMVKTVNFTLHVFYHNFKQQKVIVF